MGREGLRVSRKSVVSRVNAGQCLDGLPKDDQAADSADQEGERERQGEIVLGAHYDEDQEGGEAEFAHVRISKHTPGVGPGLAARISRSLCRH